ncbi:MAG: phenylalanine--tRNA ligase subunit beta [Candidatus Nanoperiomorbaceae bacterium]
MKISVNWLKKFATIGDVSEKELESRIGARLVEIESVEDLGAKYRYVVLAKVVSCVPHPDSDHMHLLKIDDGGAADEIVARNIAAGIAKESDKIPRDENGYVQVVCGAPNIHEDLVVAWLPPTAIVPETFGTDDEVRLAAKKLRGVISYGMCASPRELDLYAEHNGIYEVYDFSKNDDKTNNDFTKKMRENDNSFAKFFEYDNDYLLEVENKSLTHRPDTFGILGFAREVAAIFGQKMQNPTWFNSTMDNKIASDTKLVVPTVKIADPELCARYECAVFTDFDVNKTLPLLDQAYMMRSGVRPISPIVDVTNYLMLLTGQPLHAFDYNKLVAVSPTHNPDILVRAAKAGEKLLLLDGREIMLDAKDIVVCAGDENWSVPIALAGAMGGASTEIDDKTKNVLLESATFNLFNLRGTQFRHGIFSEAITRFTKGQPAALTDPVLRRAGQMFADLGARQTSQTVDNFAKTTTNPTIDLMLAKVNALLGTTYSSHQVYEVLDNLDYKVQKNPTGIPDKVQAPWWRTEVNIFEDVAEDIGRVRGFDDIPFDLPTRKFTAVANPPLYDLQHKIRAILKSFGANEVLTYSFISQKLAENLGQNPDNSYKVINAISPDLQLIRQSLPPKMLEKAHDNLRAGYDNFALFEMGQVFQKQHSGLDKNGLPIIENKLGFVIVDKNQRRESPFYLAKKYLTSLLDELGLVNVEFRESNSAQTLTNSHSSKNQIAPPYEPRRSAQIFVGHEYLGDLGELQTNFRKNLKLPEFTAIFEIDLNKVNELLPATSVSYRPIPKFQGTSRDLTIQAPGNTIFAQVEQLIRSQLTALPHNYVTNFWPLDIFAPNDDVKNITFRIEFYDQKRTIDAKIVANAVDKIATVVETDLHAKLI